MRSPPGYLATPGVLQLERERKRDVAEFRRRMPMDGWGNAQRSRKSRPSWCRAAASYVTGSIYTADGGYSAYGDVDPAAD